MLSGTHPCTLHLFPPHRASLLSADADRQMRHMDGGAFRIKRGVSKEMRLSVCCLFILLSFYPARILADTLPLRRHPLDARCSPPRGGASSDLERRHIRGCTLWRLVALRDGLAPGA